MSLALQVSLHILGTLWKQGSHIFCPTPAGIAQAGIHDCVAKCLTCCLWRGRQGALAGLEEAGAVRS